MRTDYSLTRRKYEDAPQLRKVLPTTGRLPAGHEFVQRTLVVESAKLVHRDEHNAVRLRKYVAEFSLSIEKVDGNAGGSHTRDCVLHRYKVGEIRHQQSNVFTGSHTRVDEPSRECQRTLADVLIGQGRPFRDDELALGSQPGSGIQDLMEQLGPPGGMALI